MKAFILNRDEEIGHLKTKMRKKEKKEEEDAEEEDERKDVEDVEKKAVEEETG